jgi:hypothetical protein
MWGEGESTPRSARQLLAATFALYRRYPLLFLVLAAAVVVPYQLIVLAFTGAGPLAQSSLSFGVGSLLTLVEMALVTPLISALHAHAVAEARAGRRPRLAPVARQGLRVLPVVATASIVSALGIFAGMLLLVVPGVILFFRWAVAAQAAAIEHEGWQPALRRSQLLTEGHYKHVFALLACVGLIVFVPTFLIGRGFGHDSTDLASFLVGTTVRVLANSFSALGVALLYFDLRVRGESVVVPSLAVEDGSADAEDEPARSTSWDPREYTDEDRPKGWYVDPESPGTMRYWGAADPPGWSGAATRTPRKIRRAWERGEVDAQLASPG